MGNKKSTKIFKTDKDMEEDTNNELTVHTKYQLQTAFYKSSQNSCCLFCTLLRALVTARTLNTCPGFCAPL